MPETRTFFRVQGDPPQCEAVEFTITSNGFRSPKSPLELTIGDLAFGCYALDPEAAWELAVRAKREALHEARAVSERAQEEFLAMWDARAIAMEKGDDDGK